ncbi:MAG TPA: ComF family protein [Sphingomicrobium sp.]|nr:ComF family protein [Sphingomicrobium sp.]
MTFVSKILGAGGRHALDFALPPRCSGCGTIIADMHSFCSDCWTAIHWCGAGGCQICGLPLEATDAETCGRCLAQPPRIARTRAAVEYGDVARTLVMKLKYGRKVGAAATMARFMAPLAEPGADMLLVPVPLHRWRLWSRGFNQSALLARDLAARLAVEQRVDALRRTRRTRPLKGMGVNQRRREVARAFEVVDPAAVAGRHVVLVDDVLTSGSTADECAKVLIRAGAARVDLLCFARVVRPALLAR